MPLPEDLEEPMVKVHVAQGPFETDIVVDALAREGMEPIVKKHEEIAYDGLFVLQRGWADILVPKTMAQRAKEIIEEIGLVYGESERAEGGEPS